MSKNSLPWIAKITKQWKKGEKGRKRRTRSNIRSVVEGIGPFGGGRASRASASC